MPAGGVCDPHSGGPGITPAGTTTGAEGAILDWDRQGWVTPTQRRALQWRPRPRKHGLEPSLRVERPQGESRGGTPSIVRLPKEGAPHATSAAVPPQRLPAFRHPFFLWGEQRVTKRE